MNHHKSNWLPKRTPLSAAIAAVTLTLAGPTFAEENATGAADRAAQTQSQSEYGTRSGTAGGYDAGTQTGADGSQTQSFTALDEDGNGYLDQSELQASDSEQATMDNLDTDDDGQVSRTEFAALATGTGHDMSSSGQERWNTDSGTTSGQQSAAADRSGSSQAYADQDSSGQSASSQSASTQSAGGQSQHAQAVAKIGEQEQSLTTFTKALEKAGMADALTDSTKYTIFAPTNEAFEARSGKSTEELLQPENRQELISLLRAHIVADDVDQQMAQNIAEAKTIDGGTVSLSMQNDTLQVGDASVTGSSIQQGSLRVYPIDGVLEAQGGEQTASTGSSEYGQSGQTTGSEYGQSGQTAMSGGQTGMERPEFSELDQDGDGYLSTEELEEAESISSAESTARELDSDQDGQVSRSEFAAFEPSAQEDMSGEQGRSAGDSGSAWESDEQRDQQ